jgi:hypothetical protein
MQQSTTISDLYLMYLPKLMGPSEKFEESFVTLPTLKQKPIINE